MKKLLFLAFFTVSPLFAGSDFDSFKMADQRKFIIGCGFEDPDFPHLVVRPAVRSECTFTRNAGVNGNTGLVIERKKTPADRTIFSVLNIPGTVPGTTYRVEASIRQEGLKMISDKRGFFSAISVESNYLDSGKMVPWRDGTTHYMSKGLPSEYKTISFKFTAKKNMRHFIVLKLQAYWTGKIFFDDIKVYSEGIAVTALLNTPSAHAFEPDNSRFTAMIDNAPAGAVVRARMLRNGKVMASLLLSPDRSGRIKGDFKKKFVPGRAGLELMVVQPQKKLCFLKKTFPVTILDRKLPVKGTVKVDEQGRTVIDGKKVFILGLYSSVGGKNSEDNYKRIASAGFNTIVNFGILRQPGVKDPVQYFANIRKELDKLDKYGLKISITTATMLDYYRYRIKNIGSASGAEEKILLTVKELSAHPASLFYFVSDEVPGEFLHQVIKMRELLNLHDPRHPVMALSNDPKLQPQFSLAGDIFSPDAYPVMKKNSFRDLKMITEFMSQSRRGGAAIWGTAQSFNWGYFRNVKTPEQYQEYADPSTEEMRAMALLFVIEGAKGIIFYNDPMADKMVKDARKFNDPGYPERMWKNLLTVTRELKELDGYIVGSKVPVKIRNVSGKVHAGAFRNDNGSTAVLIVSSDGRKAEAELTLPGSENLRSVHGSSTHLGKGVWRFVSNGVNADVLK